MWRSSTRTGTSFLHLKMRVRDYLSPLLQRFASFLWMVGLGLCFITAISGLWGWHLVGALQCVVLVVLVASEREALKGVLRGSLGGTADRAFGWYQVSLVTVAIAVNLMLLVRWAAHW